MQDNGNLRAALSTTDVIEVTIGFFLFHFILLYVNRCQDLGYIYFYRLLNNLRPKLGDLTLQLESEFIDCLQCRVLYVLYSAEILTLVVFKYPHASESKIQLPPRDELKTVLDKVKDFFGDAKESFGKLTALSSTTTEELEEKSKEKAK